MLLWMGLIFYGSTDVLSANRTSRFLGPFLRWLVPGIAPEAEAAVRAVIRKGGHVTEYAVLAILIGRAVRAGLGQNSVERTRTWMLLAWLGATGYAATDEFHQSFQPTRQGSIVDVGIDSAGAAVGVMALAAWVNLRERKRIC